MLSPKPWRTEAVMFLIAGVFFCLCLGAFLSSSLHHAHVRGFKTEDSAGNVIIGTLSFHGAVWALLPFFLWAHRVDWRTAFGWRDEHLKRTLGRTLLTLLLVFPIVMVLQSVSAEVLEKLGRSSENQLAVDLILNAKSPWLRAYLGFFAVVLAPVAEEFVFRGVLYPFVKQLGFPKLAWVGVSLLFAFIHDDAQIFVPLFVLALALTWLYERTDNLLAPILMHGLFNAANLVLLLVITTWPAHHE